VPVVILRGECYNFYVSQDAYVPTFSATAKVITLANLVADGKDKLHLDFVSAGHNRLSEYLMLVRDAILKGMEERGSSDPLAPAEEVRLIA
jgi:hypothetical protein